MNDNIYLKIYLQYAKLYFDQFDVTYEDDIRELLTKYDNDEIDLNDLKVIYPDKFIQLINFAENWCDCCDRTFIKNYISGYCSIEGRRQKIINLIDYLADNGVFNKEELTVLKEW
jgi:hypothetical protein